MFAFIFVLLALPLSSALADGKLVDYEKGKFQGYLSHPNKLTNGMPGILMIHNWMGVTDETITQAKRFTDLGYVVFAVDIYGQGMRPKNQDEAGKLAGKYKSDRKLFRENLKKGMKFLKGLPFVDGEKIVALGYCFGGTGAIELARSGENIKAGISFHGGLDSPAPADGANIKGKLLIHHGEIDPFIKPDDLAAFEKEMKDHKVNYVLNKYKGAVHSFTDKGAGNDIKKGAAYNADADKLSFDRTLEFLKDLFKK